MRYLFVVLVRLILGIDSRQALEVTSDSGQVLLGHVLHAVHDHITHAAEHRTAVAATGLEELHQLLLAPAAETVLVVAAQAFGNPAFQWRTAREEGAAVRGTQGFFLHGQGTRRMAGAAMSETFHQVGTAIDHRVGSGLRLMRLDCRGKHPAPGRQRPTHAQGPGNIAVLVFLGNRFDPFMKYAYSACISLSLTRA